MNNQTFGANKAKFKREITVWNNTLNIMQHVDVTITIDFDRLARDLGQTAMRNKSRKARIAKGALVLALAD